MHSSKSVKISKKNMLSFQKGIVQFFEDLILIGAAVSVEHVPDRRHVISVIGKNGIVKFTFNLHDPTYDSHVYTVFRCYDLTSFNEGCNRKINFHLINRRGMKGEDAVQSFINDCKSFLLEGTEAKLSVIAEARKNLKIKRKKIA